MEILETIDKSDMEPILAAHTGNRMFQEALYQIESPNDLLCSLGRYIHFNSVFGSGVANLAGEIGSRQDLFRELNEEVAITADRSVEVAANIFFAAIDEFGDSSKVQRSTHRTLAQSTLKAAGAFFGFTLAELNEIACPYEPTLAAISRIRVGYGISQIMNEARLFRAIGFHIGSEVLADEEFNILDGFLRARHPDLVQYLEQTKVNIDGVENRAYRWIQIHTSVEADHFRAAVVGANLALRYYAGPESRSCVKGWIIDGIKEFAASQAEFMKNLAPQR
jgi:hypothetical protein